MKRTFCFQTLDHCKVWSDNNSRFPRQRSMTSASRFETMQSTQHAHERQCVSTFAVSERTKEGTARKGHLQPSRKESGSKKGILRAKRKVKNQEGSSSPGPAAPRPRRGQCRGPLVSRLLLATQRARRAELGGPDSRGWRGLPVGHSMAHGFQARTGQRDRCSQFSLFRQRFGYFQCG